MALATQRSDGLLVTETIWNESHNAHDTNLINAANASRVVGLVGQNNAAVPLTRLDLRADSIFFQSATGLELPVVLPQAATLTCNLSTAGPIINGRDQAAAFSANSYVHAYFIWNRSSGVIATIASATAPPSGPTLPSGYTHWAYASTRRLNASTQIIFAYDRGDWVHYQARQEVVTSGSATTETSVSMASFVPSTALEIELEIVTNVGTNASGAAHSDVFIRLATGTFHLQGSGAPAAASTFSQNTRSGRIPNISTAFLYQWVDVVGTANINNRDTWIRVMAYRVPNGG